MKKSGIFFDRFCQMSTSIEPEKRNVEIKARLADDAAYEKRIEIAKKLTDTDGTILNQRDVFYKVSSGRLKLRMEVGSFILLLHRLIYSCFCVLLLLRLRMVNQC